MSLIDTHCHIDLYPNPHIIAKESEELGIITIGMTLLPSHFEIGFEHVSNYKNVHLALGMHPLHAELHDSEFDKFVKYLDKTSYIGEIGLDFSKEGIGQKEIQIESLKKILSSLSGKKKILSLHSRKAEKEVLQYLIEYNIPNAIFHWYSGSLTLIEKIVNSGYYFSINPAMLRSANGKKIIQLIPQDRVLTESDGPFVLIKNDPIKPKDIILVHDFLAELWKVPVEKVNKIFHTNFSQILDKMKPNNI